ncbi:potassium channel subfamily K member 13 [Puntigrus tetrazona]|uniref:potassium channel subfamily K member 13 n=1 Tax=Puntigrus tetrazona TaxID=1606681 RepID=UPI001C8AFC56|nr:potassium channel subfamily K member 13 [Puntigrus tetrazona]
MQPKTCWLCHLFTFYFSILMVQSDCSGRSRKGCGCIWSHINVEFARIFLLWFGIVFYALFGAAVFSALERPSELEAHCRWNRQLAEFVQDHRVPSEDLRELLGHYEEAVAAGIRMEARRPRWDFSGAFYFVATVASTIGFGMAAPATLNGKIFLIFYGLIGCAATILFFNLFLERMITLITFLTNRCRKQKQKTKPSKRRIVSNLNTQLEHGDEREGWKPSVYYVTLILATVAILVNCGASGLYSAMEDWSYLESMYFCFVAFSTMGFGDMVSGQKAHYETRWAYQVANSLMIILGVSCTYSLFSVTAIVIKQMLNWILAKLFGLHCCRSRGCRSLTSVKVKEPANQQTQNASGHRGARHAVKARLPSESKRKCASTAVETVCQSLDTANRGPSFENEIRDPCKLSKDDAEKEVFSAVSKNRHLSHHRNAREDVRIVAGVKSSAEQEKH